MSFPLFKIFLKKNLPVWAVFTAVCLLYFSVLVFTKEKFADVMGEYIPGHTPAEVSLLEYMAGIFFSTIIWVFPMIYYIFMSHKLANKAVDNTSISAFLSSSISRNKYVVTAAVYLLASIFAMFTVIFFAGMGLMMAVESLNIVNYLNVVVSTMLCTMALAMTSFFISFFLAGSKLGFALIIAVPVMFMIFNMLAETAKVLNWMNYITPMGWADVNKIAAGTFTLWWLWDLIYIAIAGALFSASLVLFKKKHLSI